MKPYLSSLPVALLLSCLIAISESFAQSVSPFHIFNTGLNMGILSTHVKNHTGSKDYGVWAGNASAEWIESWEIGTVNPISPDLSMPSIAHNTIINTIMQMETCFNPYFQARLALYRAGFHVGEGLVQTGTSCTECLQKDLQRSAIELRTISSLVKNPIFSELSENLNNIAASLTSNLSTDLASQQNDSQFTPINTIISTIQTNLPVELQQCEKKKTPETEVVVVPAITEEADAKVKKRAFAIKVGLNTGSLKGDMGSKTNSNTGWHIGFDYFRGKTIFFVVGFKWWKNATGEELMIPFPSQQIDAVDFHIQGFTTGLGLGGYVIKKENRIVSLSGKLNYLVSHAINGNLSSVGTTSVSDGAFQLELGGQVFYKFLFFELSYEFGLGEAVTSRTEKFKYNLLNVSVGVYF